MTKLRFILLSLFLTFNSFGQDTYKIQKVGFTVVWNKPTGIDSRVIYCVSWNKIEQIDKNTGKLLKLGVVYKFIQDWAQNPWQSNYIYYSDESFKIIK